MICKKKIHGKNLGFESQLDPRFFSMYLFHTLSAQNVTFVVAEVIGKEDLSSSGLDDPLTEDVFEHV